MLLLWNQRYLDTACKDFKSRHLYLCTDSLSLQEKFSIESLIEESDGKPGRAILRYRSRFQEYDPADIDRVQHIAESRNYTSCFTVLDYFEDEHGNEISGDNVGQILTGNPTTIMLKHGTKKHHIDFALSDKSPLDPTNIQLSDSQLECLGYFTRDLSELLRSPFFKEGPGILEYTNQSSPVLKTAASDSEIRSFITIFRRLYMSGEPANLLKASQVFSKVNAGHPIADLVNGMAQEYVNYLDEKPVFAFVSDENGKQLHTKRLIDVHLYTQYAHQPDDKRKRQYSRCLEAVKNQHDKLAWLFLTALHGSALHMHNAGVIIGRFYNEYCRAKGIQDSVISSIADSTTAIGTLETKTARKERIYNQKIRELAEILWNKDGCPAEGIENYIAPAIELIDHET